MNKEYGENSSDDNESDDNSEDVNEKLLHSDSGYQKIDVFVHMRLDYEAIGQKYEIKSDQLLIIKPLGQGYYSDVHMGMLSLANAKIPVAVKTPKTITGSINATESEEILRRQREALRDELKIFAHLQSSSEGGHENVLKLVGAITTVRDDFSLLTEYCECGSMDLFLQNKWKNGKFENELILEDNENDEVWKIQCDPSWSENFQSRRDNGIITTSDLLWFALQIARAMQFLAEKNVLHRDVALRNVLLKSDFAIKVADFGLSRKLNTRDDAYYCWKQEIPLPIRYIAPESLKSGRSSITSEYWSFGVVIWELFTFAEKQPYSEEFENYESSIQFYAFLLEHLSSGHRLSIPNTIPKMMKQLLSKLWDSDPKRRPSFEACENVIGRELMQSCRNMLKEETAFIHSSGYSKYDVGHSDTGTIKNRDQTFDVHVAPYSERKIVSRDISAVWMRQKIILIIILGILLALLFSIAITLAFTLLVKTPPIENYPDNITERVSQEFTQATSSTMGNPWFRRAAEQEEASRKLKLTIAHLSAQTTCANQSDEEAIKWLKRQAEHGKALAQAYLGKMFYIGQCTNQSYEEAVKWYTKAAQQGLAEAQYNLGIMYAEGKGVNQSYEQAVKWFRKAIEQDEPASQSALGNLYEEGLGVVQSYEEAVKWYTMAAEQGFAVAQYNLGFLYAEGKGVYQSYEEAVKWYTKAAEQGLAQAQWTLVHSYEEGQGVNQSSREALKWMRKLAEQGDAKAQLKLALSYEKGQGVVQSHEEAAKWWRKVEQSNAQTLFELGRSYEMGQGVDESYEEAVKWYRRAAEQGLAQAQWSLVHSYVRGQGVVQSYEEALKWMRKLAEQGDVRAQFQLALCYEKGQGVNQSYEEAAKWYTKAAEQGHAEAQFKLALSYGRGQGVNQSYEEAVKWYTKAAEQGHAEAQFYLGACYRRGQGVNQSYEEAVKWYTKAAEQGHAFAQANLGEMYELGQGVFRSYEDAEKWYEKAVEQGLFFLRNCLRILHDKKQAVVPPSDEEAFLWYRKNAEQGNTDTQYKLGFMYFGARGVPRSYEEAVKWYRKAAQQGNADGQYNLAFMHQNGKGVTLSDEEAVKWYTKAANQGLVEAQKALRMLSI